MLDEDNIFNFSDLLNDKTTYLKISNYVSFLKNGMTGLVIFVYMDPPYVPCDKKQYINYIKDGWKEKDFH